MKLKLPQMAYRAPSFYRRELFIDRAARLTAQRRRILGLLLDASLPLPDAACAPLRRIWLDEARARIDGQSMLLLTLDSQSRAGHSDLDPTAAELETALRLATTLSQLGPNGGDHPQSSSEPLRALVHDTVELFGPAIGNVAVRTYIERVCIRGARRRALVLTAYHLVFMALREGFLSCRSGTIAVTLRHNGPLCAMLTVSDDGPIREPGRLVDRSNVLADLVAVFDGIVACRLVDGGGLQVNVLMTTDAR